MPPIPLVARRAGRSGAHAACLRCALFVALGCTAAKPIHPEASLDAGSFHDAGPDAGGGDAGGGTDAGTPVCTDEQLDYDDDHCGVCGRRCESGERCVAATCTRLEPVEVAMTEGAVCVRLADGQVVCWGGNQLGQLGDGLGGDGTDAYDRVQPVAVETGEVTALRAGGGTFCALAGGGVLCWGDASQKYGAAGFVATRSPWPRALVGATGPILDVSIAATHLCARTATQVLCAGHGERGQLGRAELAPASRNVLAPAELPAGAVPVSVATGGGAGGGPFTLVALSDGRVLAFGDNTVGQLGLPVSSDPVFTPTEVMTGAAAVFAGEDVGCALDMTGGLSCWGANGRGQTGTGAVATEGVAPAPVVGAIGSVRIDAVALESRSAIATGEGGALFGWGAGTDGQHGRGPTLAVDLAEPLSLSPPPGTLRHASVSARSTCLLVEDAGARSLLCAGSNGHGELGRTDVGASYEFAPVPWFE